MAKTLSAQATVVTVTQPWTEGAYAPLPIPAAVEAAAVAFRTLHIKNQDPAEAIIRQQRIRDVIYHLARARPDVQDSS